MAKVGDCGRELEGGKGSGEVLEEHWRRQESKRSWEEQRIIWVIFGDMIGKVAWGRTVNVFITIEFAALKAVQ